MAKEGRGTLKPGHGVGLDLDIGVAKDWRKDEIIPIFLGRKPLKFSKKNSGGEGGNVLNDFCGFWDF